MPAGGLILPDWHTSAEGKQTFTALLDKSTNKRRSFAVLEKPVFTTAVIPDVFQYKIFISGKTGVGKTAAAAKLSANKVSRTHFETPGIQVSTVYWPARLTQVDHTVLFKLQLWDVGENALKRFDYMLPACMDRADGIIFMFSFVDKSSFNDLPHQMTRISADKVCRFVIGTKLDLQGQNEVTQQDVFDFEANWSLKVLSVRNIFSAYSRPGRDDIGDVAPVLNHLCEHLWRRDQVLAGKIPK